VSKPSEHPAEALSGTYRPNARGQIESVSNDCCRTLGFVGGEVSVRQPGQVQRLVTRVCVVVPPESIPQGRDCTGVVCNSDRQRPVMMSTSRLSTQKT
jgi:hypothetical protein